MSSIIVLLCLLTPPLLMWWMVKVQRRVRDQMREAPKERALPAVTPFVDAEVGADGLAYGRQVDGDGPPAIGPTPEIDGIRAIEGRR
jgi:hypothetical protein